ncbi:hypothetical protein P278_23500 [Zhouia amylolytica AD3]|uniref:ParB/Sulfiredoxin domain-containing protein n=1 Tax=Zhouia amylolytica AD3 TaxID=1286632 RepID=W2UK84_9FLAO|nr:hypothetical protein P278_23500 [Zhouia amylolytica AD3]
MSERRDSVSQAQIIDYLIEKEKVLNLAKDIISMGYFRNESPIVVKENGRFHVLEGNRRVSACKILINPDLIKSSVKRNNIKKLLRGFDLGIIEKLEVIVAPSREEADVMIVNRHTGGSVVEKWDKTKQDRFLYKRFSSGETVDELADKLPLTKTEIKDSLKRYNVYMEISQLELGEKVLNSVKDETKFSMTNFERVYQNEKGLEFLGFDFDDDFTLKKQLPKTEFVKRFSRIVEDVVGNTINSRVLNKKSDTDSYIDNLRKLSDFDTSIRLDSKYNDEYKDEEVKSLPEKESKDDTKPKRPRPTSIKLFASSLHFVTGVGRIDDIFEELKILNIKKQPNAVAVLFRSYLDMIAYQFLKSKNGITTLRQEQIDGLVKGSDKKFEKVKKELNKMGIDVESLDQDSLKKVIGLDKVYSNDRVPSLREMLVFISKSEGLVPDGKLRQALGGYLNSNTKLLGHSEYNLLVHNEYFTAEPEELKLVWSQMQPLLEYLISEIK